MAKLIIENLHGDILGLHNAVVSVTTRYEDAGYPQPALEIRSTEMGVFDTVVVILDPHERASVPDRINRWPNSGGIF